MRPTTGKIIKGTCLLTEKPFIYALKSKFKAEKCDFCLGDKNGKVLKCSGCCYVYYCDRNCQKEAWPDHKTECPTLKKIFPKIVPDAARLLSKIILKLKKGGDLERGYYSKTRYRKFRDLMSHYEEIRNDPKRMEHLESLEGVLKDLLGDHSMPNQVELIGIYGRLITNGFNILDGEMNSIATGLYLGISIVDHNCEPNAVATFEGTQLFIRTLIDIPEPVNWDNVFICYIDVMNCAKTRRKNLKENYYFLCTCTKCICNEEEEKTMRLSFCPNCKNGIDVLDKTHIICSNCNNHIPQSFVEEYNRVMEFTIDKLEEMKDTAYLDVCKILIGKQKSVFHPLNLWHVKTLDLAFESAILLQKWDEAMELGLKLLPGFRKYNGDWNPLLGILLMKISKLELLFDRKTDAREHLREAEKILKITHSSNHSLYQNQLIPLLLDAEL